MYRVLAKEKKIILTSLEDFFIGDFFGIVSSAFDDRSSKSTMKASDFFVDSFGEPFWRTMPSTVSIVPVTLLLLEFAPFVDLLEGFAS